MRDLLELVGLGHVASFLARLVGEHAAELQAAASEYGGEAAAGGARAPAWTRLESSLYACNVALCSGAGTGGWMAAADAGCVAAAGSGPRPSRPSLLRSGRAAPELTGRCRRGRAHRHRCDLCAPPGSALGVRSAAVGQHGGAGAHGPALMEAPPVDNDHVSAVVAIAAAAVTHPASSLKLAGRRRRGGDARAAPPPAAHARNATAHLLSQDRSLAPRSLTSPGPAACAGTALTLLGGLAGWLGAHPDQLRAPLEALRAALGSADEKLSRNAATTLTRLLAAPSACAALLGRYSDWPLELEPLLPGADVPLRHRPGEAAALWGSLQRRFCPPAGAAVRGRSAGRQAGARAAQQTRA
jgi:hypothetical protein